MNIKSNRGLIEIVFYNIFIGLIFAINSYSQDFNYYYSLADSLSSQHKYDESITAYQKAIELEPASYKAHNDLGFVYFKINKLDEATSEFQTAIDLKKDYYTGYNNLGIVFYHKKNLNKSEECFNKAIKLNPKYAKAMINLAVIYWKKGKYIKAAKAYRKALKIDKKYTDKRVDKKKAKEEFDKTLALNPNNKELKYLKRFLKFLAKF